MTALLQIAEIDRAGLDPFAVGRTGGVAGGWSRPPVGPMVEIIDGDDLDEEDDDEGFDEDEEFDGEEADDEDDFLEDDDEDLEEDGDVDDDDDDDDL